MNKKEIEAKKKKQETNKGHKNLGHQRSRFLTILIFHEFSPLIRESYRRIFNLIEIFNNIR